MGKEGNPLANEEQTERTPGQMIEQYVTRTDD